MIFGAQRLRSEQVTAFIQRHPRFVVGLVCFVWMLPGLVGRDPWKSDEAVHFGIVYEMLTSGKWLVPHLGGEAFLRFPPLYHWTAAASAFVFSPILALPDGARLINLAYGALAFVLTAATARRLYGADRDWVAVLLLVGSVGLVLPAHHLLPSYAFVAATAATLCALAWFGNHPLRAAVGIAFGVSLAFLCDGIVSAAILLIVVLVMPIASASFRNRRYASVLIGAIIMMLPLIAFWPASLYSRSPAMLHEFVTQNTGWYTGATRPGSERDSPFFYLEVLPWFASPFIPFTAWSIWKHRDRLQERQFLIPLVTLVIALLVLSGAYDSREFYALPMLLPLALLAVPGIARLPRGGLYLFFWFSIMFFLFFFAVAWFYWSAVDLGIPAPAARAMARMEPGYVPVRSPVLILIAAALTLLWFIGLFNVRRSAERPFLAWATGAAVFWGLLMTLMIGWVNHAKSHRTMIQSLAQTVSTHQGCIASMSLTDAQRGLMHYFGNIKTRRVGVDERAAECELMLIEGKVDSGTMDMPWTLLWEGHRLGDNRERFRLYRKAVPADARIEKHD